MCLNAYIEKDWILMFRKIWIIAKNGKGRILNLSEWDKTPLFQGPSLVMCRPQKKASTAILDGQDE